MKTCKFSLLFLPSSLLSCTSNKQSFSHSVEKRCKKSSSILEARNLLILFTLYTLKFNGSKLKQGKWDLGGFQGVILLVLFPYFLSFLSFLSVLGHWPTPSERPSQLPCCLCSCLLFWEHLVPYRLAAGIEQPAQFMWLKWEMVTRIRYSYF